LQTLQELYLARCELSRSNPVQKGTTRGGHLFQLWKAHAHTLEEKGENMITPRMRRRIKRELSGERPTVWIGKEGATPKTVKEISRHLEKREMVKVKILKSALKEEETRSIASKISQQTASTLIDIRGHTLILYRPRKKKKQL